MVTRFLPVKPGPVAANGRAAFPPVKRQSISPNRFEAGKQMDDHSSDCALHNAPAYAPRWCDCNSTEGFFVKAWRFLRVRVGFLFKQS